MTQFSENITLKTTRDRVPPDQTVDPRNGFGGECLLLLYSVQLDGCSPTTYLIRNAFYEMSVEFDGIGRRKTHTQFTRSAKRHCSDRYHFLCIYHRYIGMVRDTEGR